MNSALVILDMQNYFFRTPEKRAAYPSLIRSLNELVAAFDRTEGFRIYNVVSVHKADRSTWSRNMLRNNAGCLIEGTEDAAVVDDLQLGGKPVTVPKTRHSAFLRTDLERRLRADGVERVALAGVYTHGCVALSAVDAWSLDFDVAVAADCVFSHRRDLADFCVERLRNMLKIDFLTNDFILQNWISQAENGAR